MRRIKFGEVKVTEIAKKHIAECLESHYVTMGAKTKELESSWRAKFGYSGVKAVGSGTNACMAACMALYSLGAKPGDEVIVPALSFIATANAVRAAGFTPIFCDVKLDDMLMDETLLEDLITDKTVAVMPVSLMGKPPKMDVICSIAAQHNLRIILDNCEGHGCKYQGEYMSQYADYVVYSCYAAHILFSGELGLVGSRTTYLDELIDSVRSHGRNPGSLYFDHSRFGLNLKPTDLHASIGLGSILEFDPIIETRTKNLNYIKSNLANLKDYFWFTEEESGDTNSPHAFSLTLKPDVGLDVKDLQYYFDNQDIEWKRNFGAMPDHGCFSYLGKEGTCPNATYIGNNGIHVGVHQYLTKENLRRIVTTVQNFIKDHYAEISTNPV